MKKYIKENIVKNILSAILLIILYFPIQNFLMNSPLATDKSSAGDILVALSIIIVTACFGNFAFTYEKINIKSNFERYISHILTGALNLIIGISLIITSMLIYFLMGSFILINIILTLLYLSCIAYDFFDLFKIVT